MKSPCVSASKSRNVPAERSRFSPVFWWISCGWMCKSPQLIHGGWKGLSTIFKSPEHTFFCRIERLFVVRLFRQILSKNGEKKLSTKNILYYYNYYFHVPIKKGFRVGYAHARIATDATDRYAVSVSRYTKRHLCGVVLEPWVRIAYARRETVGKTWDFLRIFVN